MRSVILGVLVAAALIAVPSSAPEQSASTQGLVKDSQGGVLPGVTVEARNAQGAVASTVTDGRGAYRFPSLLPGKYDVTAQLASFNTYTVEGVGLLLGQIKTVDFTLQLAASPRKWWSRGKPPGGHPPERACDQHRP